VSDLHPRARALIDAAKRSEGSLSPDMRARVHRSVLRRAVALGAAVATASTTSAVSKAAALLAALPGSLAIPAMVTAVAGAALVVFEARSTPRLPPPFPSAPMHAVAPAPGPPPRAAADAEPVATNHEPPRPAAAVAQVAPAPMPAQALRPRPAANPTPVAAPERAPTEPASAEPPQPPSPPLAMTEVPAPGSAVATHLAEDLALLQQARRALQAGDAATALSLLDRPGSPIDAGPLAEEAQLARISALCQLGRTTEAHAATERLLAAWPGSPAAKRLRDGCTVLVAPRKGSDD
jgi:hypothetical protein